MNNKDRISIRFTPEQFQILTELKDKLNTSYSCLVRTMVGSFISTNEDILENIITK